MDEEKQGDATRPEKCGRCYWNFYCMLMEETRNKCGGPWKDHEAHLKYVEKEVMEQKKPAS